MIKPQGDPDLSYDVEFKVTIRPGKIYPDSRYKVTAKTIASFNSFPASIAQPLQAIECKEYTMFTLRREVKKLISEESTQLYLDKIIEHTEEISQEPIEKYPGRREELVEMAIRKLLVEKKERGDIVNDQLSIMSTLYEVQKKLEIIQSIKGKTKRTCRYSIDQIKEAIKICGNAEYTLEQLSFPDGLAESPEWQN